VNRVAAKKLIDKTAVCHQKLINIGADRHRHGGASQPDAAAGVAVIEVNGSFDVWPLLT
jgi:hypothetical protein